MKKKKENKEKNDSDKFGQHCFESWKKYVEEKIILEGQFLHITTIANYKRELQESMKLQMKRDTPQNIKSRLIHAFGDKLSFFKIRLEPTSLFIMMWIIVKMCLFLVRRKLKKFGSLLKAKLKNSP